MPILDIILAIILALAVFSGLRKGLIRSLGRIFGLVFGAFFASRFYLTLFEWGRHWAGDHEAAGKIIAFVVLFIIATQLIQLIFYIIEKIFNLLAFIPGSKYINNILGGALGLLESALFLGLIAFVIIRYTPEDSGIAVRLADSLIVPWLLKAVNLILPVLPEALKALKTIF